jgi:hypothetical protein
MAALSNAERQAKWRAKRNALAKQALQQQTKEPLRNDGDMTRLQAENAALKKENAALKAARRPAADAPARTGRRLERPSELDKLRTENVRLRALLQEDPDAAKLRKKVVELQAQAHSMRVEMKRLAKERDKFQRFYAVMPSSREARRLLTRKTYNDIIKALHSDRLRHVAPSPIPGFSMTTDE